MTTQLDYSVGISKETVYGTAVAPSRFFESDAQMKYDVQKVQSSNFRAGSRVNRLARNVLKHIEVSGDQTIEVTTKGFGFLLEAALGAVTNTAVPTTNPVLYQQVHTLRTTDPATSYTIQEVLPTLGGGAGNPHTFTGCMLDSIELSAKEGGIVEAKLSWVGRDMQTNVAAGAASYPVGDELFTFVQGTIGLAGALTEPTTTALASLSGQASSNISDFSLSVKNNLDSDGYNFGGKGRRSRANAVGNAEITGKMTAEYTSNDLRDAYIAQTPLPFVMTFKTQDANGNDSGPVLQIVLPAILLKGEVPASNGGKPITQSIDFEAFDNSSATKPIWIIYRTFDTAV